jgi:hypothetical protein
LEEKRAGVAGREGEKSLQTFQHCIHSIHVLLIAVFPELKGMTKG